MDGRLLRGSRAASIHLRGGEDDEQGVGEQGRVHQIQTHTSCSGVERVETSHADLKLDFILRKNFCLFILKCPSLPLKIMTYLKKIMQP